MEQLAIRLGSSLHDPVHWLVWSSTEQEILASGTLPDGSDLSAIKQRAPQAQVIAIVPASDALFKQLELPPKANRKVLSAIPFMLEDDIASDIHSNFFALGQKRDNHQQVAVVQDHKMQQWRQQLQDADLHASIMVPDAIALASQNGSSILSIDNTLLAVLTDPNTTSNLLPDTLAGELSWLAPIVLQKLTQQPHSITLYSELSPTFNEQLNAACGVDNVLANYELLPMQRLLEGALKSPLNLLQGKYLIKQNSANHWKKWRVAAVLLAVALSANLITKSIQLQQTKVQREEVNAQIKATVKQGFPQLGKVVSYRKVIAKELRRLEQNGGGISMLVMLSSLSEAFNVSGVKPQSLRFDAARTELRMQSIASNFEALEQFKRDAQTLGFEVEQGAINNKGSQVSGTLVIKG